MDDNKQFKEGVIWNFASLIFLALSGIVLNICIGIFYDPAALGIFNQALATYVFFSMFAVGGINLSALKYISESPADHFRTKQIVISAVLLTVMSSAFFTFIFLLLRPYISSWLQSDGVATGMLWISPGLFCFGINKTLLSVINALHLMKAFAVFQSLRYFNLLIGFFLALILDLPGEKLAYVFSFSELILLITTTTYLRTFWSFPLPENWYQWILPHIVFGTKGALSGALLELNSRVDILMLGYFLSDSKTGIYSFAALVFEGIMQFLIVLQANYNPHLSRLLKEGKLDELTTAFKHGRNKTYLYGIVLVPALLLLYPLGMKIAFFNSPEFMESWLPFGILILGLFISSGYLPFHNLLVMGGHPSLHTLFMILTVSINIFSNYLLIPLLGLPGAALGTALSLIFSNLILIFLARRYLKINLI